MVNMFHGALMMNCKEKLILGTALLIAIIREKIKHCMVIFVEFCHKFISILGWE